MGEDVGAILMGRRSYDLAEGDGGWGDGGPAGPAPCFVLTHAPPVAETVRAPDVFTFVTSGIHDAVEQAKAAGQLARRLRVLSHPALLIVDEIGYLPVSRDGAVLFFQLINARYEHASTVLTSNKGFEEWGEILGDEVMAAALIDRLMHHCHVVNIRGNSYRMREHTDLWQSIQEKQNEPPTGAKRRRKEAQTV